MALSETFPAVRAARSLIPITARELVEWTYAEQRAQGVRDDVSLDLQGRSQTGVILDLLTEFAQLGCRVDRSASAVARWGEIKCHEDAITVHGVVAQLAWRKHELLIEYGRQRRVPDWAPKIFPFACVPVVGNRGKPKGIYLTNGKHVGSEITYEGDWPDAEFADRSRRSGEAHKQIWGDEQNWPQSRATRRGRPAIADHNWSNEPYRRCADQVLAQARKIYCEWYEALWALCDGLEAVGPRGLAHYRISDLGAAYEPWRA